MKTDMPQTNLSPKEIADSVKRDLIENRHLSIAEAAKMINRSPQTLFQILKGESRMRMKTAALLSDTFGYPTMYLMYGIGDLYPVLDEEPTNTALPFHIVTPPANVSAREKALWKIEGDLQDLLVFVNNRFPLGVHFNFRQNPFPEIDLSDFSEKEKDYLHNIMMSISLITQVIDITTIVDYVREIKAT